VSLALCPENLGQTEHRDTILRPAVTMFKLIAMAVSSATLAPAVNATPMVTLMLLGSRNHHHCLPSRLSPEFHVYSQRHADRHRHLHPNLSSHADIDCHLHAHRDVDAYPECDPHQHLDRDINAHDHVHRDGPSPGPRGGRRLPRDEHNLHGQL
jgi:hypothetical protein